MVGYANLELVQWIFETLPTKRTVTTSDIEDALSQDIVSIELFEWLNAHFPALLNSAVVESAAKRDCFMNAVEFDAAAGQGHLDVVAFLHEEHLKGYSKAAMYQVAAGGYLQVIKFLHGIRIEGCSTAAMAAENGFLEEVEFLHAHRTEGCTGRILNQAAANGLLQVVRFLHGNH